MIDILTLLPYSLDSLLTDQGKKLKILKLLKFLVQELYEALYLFKSKEVLRFDAHVGDTLCQIRAYKILLLVNRGLPSIVNEVIHFINSLNHYLNEFELLIKNKKGKFVRDLDGNESIQEFFHKRGLIFNLDKEFIFLTQAKILSDYSKIDSDGISRGIDYVKFSEKMDITNNLSKKIMHWCQKKLSSISSCFVYELLKEVSELYGNRCFLKLLEKKDRDGRIVLPSYEVTKILIMHILKQNILIVLTIERKIGEKRDKFNLFFLPNKKVTEFELVKKKSLLSKTPCLIISGVSVSNEEKGIAKNEFISQILKIGLSNVIKLNMACHPQYSAQDLRYLNADPYLNSSNFDEKKKTQLNDLKEEFINMKKLGNKLGCCKENPTLFFIKHVLCGMFKLTNCDQPALYDCLKIAV